MKRLFAMFVLTACAANAETIVTGIGTNISNLILNFPADKQVTFQHRWNGETITGKVLLESVIHSTGGEVVVTEGFLTPFALAVEGMTNPTTIGLVVHYQNSYTSPYINGIRWNGPDGLTGADYQFPDNWWHLWAQGPAHVDQSFAWPNPLPPVDLAPGSAWFFGEFSGLADLTLSDGASIGLVYGSALAPTPEPSSLSLFLAGGAVLMAGRRRKSD